MEKIIITCSAEYLSYEFPKRKWYQVFRTDRIAVMRLASVQDDILEMDIQLRIKENFQDGFLYEIHPMYRRDVCRAMFRNYQILHEQAEHIILLDLGDELLPDLVYELSENRNYLTILTDRPQDYDAILQKIEQEFGLVGMVFTDNKEFGRYLKAMPKEIRAFAATGGSGSVEREAEKSALVGKNKGNILYQLPKKSFLLDFCDDEFFCSHILKKRMHFTYVSTSIFLDNVVQNRYNAIVNEGITFQVINDKKTIWRRKGNHNGRKEEYSDL